MDRQSVKEVDFNGSPLLATQDKDTEKVYVGVRWVSEGIGLSAGQIKSERKKLQEDIVLKQGGRNFVLPTGGGVQEVLCIELDYLPLWLAKISITPKMRQDSPDTVNKLIKYQLKAKDVLVNAFIPSHNQQSIEDLIIMQAQSMKDTKAKEQLEKKMTTQ